MWPLPTARAAGAPRLCGLPGAPTPIVGVIRGVNTRLQAPGAPFAAIALMAGLVPRGLGEWGAVAAAGTCGSRSHAIWQLPGPRPNQGSACPKWWEPLLLQVLRKSSADCSGSRGRAIRGAPCTVTTAQAPPCAFAMAALVNPPSTPNALQEAHWSPLSAVPARDWPWVAVGAAAAAASGSAAFFAGLPAALQPTCAGSQLVRPVLQPPFTLNNSKPLDVHPGAPGLRPTDRRLQPGRQRLIGQQAQAAHFPLPPPALPAQQLVLRR